MGDLLGSPRVALLFCDGWPPGKSSCCTSFLCSVLPPGLYNQTMMSSPFSWLRVVGVLVLRELATRFVTTFRTTFIFNASPSDFSIKSYDRLKFSHDNFWQLQIYHYSVQSEDSSIKYTLKQDPTKKIRQKFNFYLFLMHFTKIVLPCSSILYISRPILCLTIWNWSPLANPYRHWSRCTWQVRSYQH